VKLIVEQNLDGIEYLVEGTEPTSKKYYIEGVFAQAGIKNRNGRIYAQPIMESAINNYINDYVKQKRALGELSHPTTPSVNLDRACHIVESLTWRGSDVIGRARVLSETPMGKIVKNLIDEGVKIGVSTRGMGSVKMNAEGINEVQNDFSLRAIDVVYDPSAPAAFVNGIMEGTEWIFDVASESWKSQQVIEQARQMGRKEWRKLQESQVQLWSKFIRNL